MKFIKVGNIKDNGDELRARMECVGQAMLHDFNVLRARFGIYRLRLPGDDATHQDKGFSLYNYYCLFNINYFILLQSSAPYNTLNISNVAK